MNASFHRNRFGDFVIQFAGGDTVLTGNRLPIAPDVVLNVGANFSFTKDLDVTFDAMHVGAVQVDQGNTYELSSYTLVDAAVSWCRGPLCLRLSAHDLFNEEYSWNGDVSRGQSADIGRPRQVMPTVSFIGR